MASNPIDFGSEIGSEAEGAEVLILKESTSESSSGCFVTLEGKTSFVVRFTDGREARVTPNQVARLARFHLKFNDVVAQFTHAVDTLGDVLTEPDTPAQP
jgi:hypothetical protein